MNNKSLFFSIAMLFFVGFKLCDAISTSISKDIELSQEELLSGSYISVLPTIQQYDDIEDVELQGISAAIVVKGYCPITPVGSPVCIGEEEDSNDFTGYDFPAAMGEDIEDCRIKTPSPSKEVNEGTKRSCSSFLKPHFPKK